MHGPIASSADEYRFVFSATRATGREIQLQEVRLCDSAGAALNIASADNPKGEYPRAHPPANAADGDATSRSSKWLDAQMQRRGASTMVLALAPGASSVASYGATA